jgi:hypothetical protein
MFRGVGHRLPALLNAGTIFRRRGQRKGAQGWSIIAPLVGRAAHQWLTVEMRREEIENN